MNFVPSPCIGWCKLHPETLVCSGCGRTNEEIAVWRVSSNETRARIVENAALRRFESAQKPLGEGQ